MVANEKKKVLIGMSGGVDSSVSAKLLLDEGYYVEGVQFTLSPGIESDAKAICEHLGIKFTIVDFSKVFASKVFAPFINSYQSGKTPNLCVECNKLIKFGALFEYAMENGFDYLATGHYCSTKKVDGKTMLLCPFDKKKDQTYFLNQVSEEALKKTLFPLRNLSKEQVRKIAESNSMITADKKGSSDICLMGNQSFRQFISPYLKECKGKILTLEGDEVGEHTGLYNYTLGQRKGLGLGGKKGETGRWFVVKKDVEKNILYVSHGNEEPLFSQSLILKQVNWIGYTFDKKLLCQARTRYSQELTPVEVEKTEQGYMVNFFAPQRALTQGQYCVFYKNGFCLGGGVIE